MLLLSSCSKKDNDKIRQNFQEVVDQMNQSTPMQIDEYTVLKKLSLGEELHIIYHYALDTQLIKDDNHLTDEIILELNKLIIPMLCSNEQIVPLLEAQAQFEFIFSELDNEEIKRFSITEAQCVNMAK